MQGMKYGSGKDKYCYPNTEILINKHNIRDEKQLLEFEGIVTQAKLIELFKNPMQGSFDLQHLQKIHQFLFEDIYDFAGKIRDVNITKGSTTFCPSFNIENYAEGIFKQLKSENYLIGKSFHELVKGYAYYMCEINMLHPFREGNGRAIKEFMRTLSLQNHYHLEFRDVKRDVFINAMIQAAHFNLEALEKIIQEELRPF